MMACASIDTAPVSSVVISAETVAAGAPSTRVTVPWISTCSTLATWPSGCVPTVPLTGSARRPSTPSTPSSSSRRIVSTTWPSSSAYEPIDWPTSTLRRAEPICAVEEPIMAARLGSTATEIWGASATASLATLSTPSSILSSRTMRSLASLMSEAFRPLTTMASPPPAPVKSCSEMVTSKPSCATGARDSLMSSRALPRSTSSARRTMSTALLEARPAKAAWRAWAPVSASPGMVDCTSSTSSLAIRISSASMVRSWTPAVEDPAAVTR